MQLNMDAMRRRDYDGAFFMQFGPWQQFPGTPPAFLEKSIRPLSPNEIAQLESQGNQSSDWGQVFVYGQFELAFIRNNCFGGSCILFAPVESQSPAIIENSRMWDCAIGRGALILDVTRMMHTVVAAHAEVTRCGTIGSTAKHHFGLGSEIAFAPGSGQRRMPVTSEARADEIAELALRDPKDPEISQWRDHVRDFAATCESTLTMICRDAKVSNVGTLQRAYIGPGAQIDGLPLGEDIILLSTRERPSRISASGTIRGLVAQELVEISGGARVEHAYMGEATWARSNAVVNSSILAPNSGVANGELSSTYLGPFVGFSHQALCIATFWLGGRGNVSYGANVGSNHSGRAADQEHFAGEGVFYGLGCTIKFPFNSLKAPYSLIASGVTCLPQKIEYPFSLINSPVRRVPEIPEGWNELMPGWQVGGNLYGLLRNAEKYSSRNRAVREPMKKGVFREDFEPMVKAAMTRLSAALTGPAAGEIPTVGKYYTEKQLPGVGKNFVTDHAVRAGVEFYRFALELIAYLTRPDALTAEQQRALVRRILTTIKANRQKDDSRGVRVIPDYARIHGSVDTDPLVRYWRSVRDSLE